MLICYGCKAEVDASERLIFACPNVETLPEIDHVLAPVGLINEDVEFPLDGHTNPFIRYRDFLYPYRLAMEKGLSDENYCAMVEKMDTALIEVDGVGFHETPLTWSRRLDCFIKSEAHSVGQSHKARHLFEVMLYLKVLAATSPEISDDITSRRLAVASCGNAGLAAATIAAAAKWPIDVYVPPNASPAVIAQLKKLKADVQLCHRKEGQDGDPCMEALNAAVTAGSIPFSVQGNANGLVVEGSCTILFEIIAALKRDHGIDQLGAIYTQVGGGAFGSGIVHALRKAVSRGIIPHMPVFNTVQTEGGHPLHRAHQKMVDNLETLDPAKENRAKAISEAVSSRSKYMYAWEDPHSIAHGLLDDETYDWANLCDGMLQTGGDSIVVGDERVCEATEIGHIELGVNCCHTGATGLAGLLEQKANGSFKTTGGACVAIFTGLNRDNKPAWPSDK